MSFLNNMLNSLSNGASGIVSGTIGGISQIFTNKKNIQAQKEAQQREYEYQTALNAQAQKYNLQNMEIQNRYAMENWLKQQEYNSPENQLNRIKDAGINPNLVMGSSGVVNSANSSPDTPDSQTPTPGSVSQYSPNIQNAFTSALDAFGRSLQFDSINQDIRNKQATENLTNAEVENTLQNTLKQQQETLSFLLDNQKKTFENSKLKELWEWRVREMQANIKHTEEAIYNLHRQSNLHDTNADLNIARKHEVNKNISKLTAEEEYVRIQSAMEAELLAYYKRNGWTPNENIVQRLMSLGAKALNSISKGKVPDNLPEPIKAAAHGVINSGVLFQNGFRPGMY